MDNGQRAGSERWFAPEKRGRWMRWILLLATVGTLLTNGYYVKFAEPAVSRQTIALGIVLLTLAWFAVCHYGVPRSRAELAVMARKRAVAVLLVLIVAVAFGFRLWGAPSGLPQSYIPDEYDHVNAALKMIKRGDLNPHWWHYPTLWRYLNVGTYLAVFFVEVPSGRWDTVQQIVEEDMLYWGRFVGVLFGAGAVLLTFWLGRRVFGTRVGLLAAALLAVFPAAVEHSQVNKPDPILVFMTVLAALAALTYFKQGGPKLAFVAGLTIGLTAGTKYNGALVVLPFLAAVALRQGPRLLLRPDIFLGGLGAVLGFFASSPFFITELPQFADHVAEGLYTYGATGLEGAEGTENWHHHASYTVRYGAGLWSFLAALGGLGLALYRLDGRLAVFLVFPVLYYAYYSSQLINFPGNLTPVYPFLAILAAYGASEVASRLARGLSSIPRMSRLPWLEPLLLSGLVVLLLWFPFGMSIEWNRRASLPDTGNLARQWIESRFPAGTHFAVERHTPVLDGERYEITMEARIINRAVKDYRAAGVEYLIVSEILYRRYSAEHRQTQNYQKLFRICPLVREFEPVEGKLIGPAIRILQVPPDGGVSHFRPAEASPRDLAM